VRELAGLLCGFFKIEEIWGHHTGEKGIPINRDFFLKGFLKWQDFQEQKDLAIPNGIALAQAMVSGLTGNAARLIVGVPVVP
jgi:hypothetical protein